MPVAIAKPIRVLVVDDHAMVRRGLATFLKAFDDLQLVGEAESGEAAVELCAETLPDVVLMDMVMQNMDGASATSIIRKQHPQTQVIALTSFKEGELIKKVLEAGAIGLPAQRYYSRGPGQRHTGCPRRSCYACERSYASFSRGSQSGADSRL